MRIKEIQILNPEEVVKYEKVETLISRLTGLTPSEVEILFFLLKNRNNEDIGFSIGELVEKTGKSKATVERCIKRLCQLGLVKRRIALSKKGYYLYVYYIDNPIETLEKLKEIAKMYFNKLQNELDRLIEVLKN